MVNRLLPQRRFTRWIVFSSGNLPTKYYLSTALLPGQKSNSSWSIEDKQKICRMSVDYSCEMWECVVEWSSGSVRRIKMCVVHVIEIGKEAHTHTHTGNPSPKSLTLTLSRFICFFLPIYLCLCLCSTIFITQTALLTLLWSSYQSVRLMNWPKNLGCTW